jgi:hypothetical protein
MFSCATIIAVPAAAAAAAEGGGSTLLVVVIGVGVVTWLWSVWRHPFAPCRVCKGTPKKSSTLFPKAFDLCRACGGRGRRVRMGARLFGRNEDVQ